MSIPRIQSEALQRAALRSERVRVIGLLCALGVMLAAAVLRGLVSQAGFGARLVPIAFATAGAMIVYELGMLSLITRAIRSEQLLPSWTWRVNVALETLFPTGLLLLLSESPILGPYRTLVAPVALTYFFFIVLSTLRLSPRLSMITGAFSAAGYLAVTAYTFWSHPSPDPASGAFAPAIYLTYAVVILVAGLTAAAVAAQIRGHVVAALQEARRAERLRHDLEIARAIQQGLLPERPPEIEGFDIAGWNKPADQTGGDYFDWFRLSNGRTVLTLGDVTGHGIGPALVTTACRAYGRASLPVADDLGAALDTMDQLLAADLPAGKLVTFVAAVLDPAGGSVRLLSAGHGPLLVYRAADGKIERFKAHGVPLGTGVGPGYGPAQTVALERGDVLVLITDGFFEWENAREEPFGFERLEATIRDAGSRPAAEIISSMYEAVVAFAGGTEQADDLTAVVVKRE